MSPLIAIGLGALYTGLAFLRFQDFWSAGFIGVGLLLGIGLLWLDEEIGYTWYTEPDQLANKHLITRSPLFWLAYVPLTVFVITSSGSLIGSGLVLGIGVVLAIEMLQTYRQPAAFEDRFLKQVSRPLTESEVTKIVWFATAWVVVLAGVILW